MANEGAERKTAHNDLVVFWLRNETACSECGRELTREAFLFKEREKGLCLACADLDHLEFLARGDPALTRRASKHSRLRAVVVRWSRTRKRYERQGILLESEAIDRAQEECAADREFREARREREAERRAELDLCYVEKFARKIRERYPGCPPGEERTIAEHACRKYSGRVGRSQAAKEFSPEAIDLAVEAHLRHRYTPYDELLMRYERREAREAVRARVEQLLQDSAAARPRAPRGGRL